MAASLGNHTRPIDRLYLVCGDFVKEKGYNWTDYKENFTQAFFFDFLSSSAVHYPPTFCKKCYFKMKNILKRPSASMNALCSLIWLPHPSTGECKVCKLFDENKNFRGGKVPKKKFRTGKPSQSEVKFWTRDSSKTLEAKFKWICLPTYLELDDFEEEINPQLSLCVCNLCKNLLRKATILSICEHTFCLQCILQKVEGVYLNKLPKLWSKCFTREYCNESLYKPVGIVT